tara:strand:+ start:4790 stop:5200 length:411 start_codon:yes stop_codon:yes gene_type:complete
MTPIIRKLKELVDPQNFVKSTWLFGMLILFLAMYGARLQPKLPKELMNLFKNPLFRGVILFLVVYLSERDMGAALTIVVIFVVTMNLLHSTNALDNIRNTFAKETFESDGRPLASCALYSKKNPIYPVFGEEQDLE